MIRSTRSRRSPYFLLPAVLTLLAGSHASLAAVVAGTDLSPPAAETAVIAETYRLVEELGERIWPGFAAVPFPVVLVTEEVEFLIGWNGAPPKGFLVSGTDPRLGPIATRGRIFSPALGAAFPAFGPPAVVVIGTMRRTERSPARWALTLLHEHFHQLQYAAPDYDRDVEALGLSGGDQTGMWMLDYPFPYDDEAIGSLFAELADITRRAVDGEAAPGEPWAALRRLSEALTPDDARYLSFQLWQEGVGRYLELRAARVAAAAFAPSAEFVALGGFTGWQDEAAEARRRVLDELARVSLAESRRVSFYPLGAALAMLLDAERPQWKDRYLELRFRLPPPAPPEPAGVEITYLANEGFLLAAGDDKVLIDALFPGIDGYARVPLPVRSRLERAEAPFDGVDLVLATHFHRDHFGAAEVARFLAASSATLLTTPDAVARLPRSAKGAFEVVARHPAEGARSLVAVDDLRVTVLNLHHGRSRSEIQNLGFLVEIGGLKILHVGDTEATAADIEPYDLGREEVDVALLPGWIFAEPSWRPLVAAIGARHLVVMHLATADAPASWFGSAGSREGRVRSIRSHFPEVWIPHEPLASRRFAAAP